MAVAPSNPTDRSGHPGSDDPDDPGPDVAEGPDRAVSRSWPVTATLVGVTAFGLAWRWWLSTSIDGPFLYHDEEGYVAVGQALVGRAPQLHGPHYAPGYGLLVAPVLAVTDPGRAHAVLQLINSLAVAALVPVLYLLARRLAGQDRWTAVGLVVVATTAADLAVLPQMLLPEACFVLVTAVTVLVTHQLLERPSLPLATTVGLLAAGSYLLHTRGLAVVALVAVAVGGGWWRGRVPPGPALVAAAATVAGGLATVALDRWATAASYPAGTIGPSSASLSWLVDDPVQVGRTALGHLWYPVFSTAGIAAVGLVAAAVVAARQRGSVRGLLCLALVVGVAVSAVLSGVVHARVYDRVSHRPDILVYGRYLLQWVPVLVVLAPLAWTELGRRGRAATVGGIGLFSGAVAVHLHWSQPGSVWASSTAWHNIASLRLLVVLFDQLYVVRAALVMVVAIPALFAPALLTDRRRWWILPAVVAVAGNLGAAPGVVQRYAAPASRHWMDGHRLGPVLEEIDLPVAIGTTTSAEFFYLYNLQYWHPDLDVRIGPEGVDGRSAPLVLTLDDAPPPSGGPVPPRRVGQDPTRRMVLWAVDPEAFDRIDAGDDETGP